MQGMRVRMFQRRSATDAPPFRVRYAAALLGMAASLAAVPQIALAQTSTQTRYGAWLLSCYEPGPDQEGEKSCILSHRVTVQDGPRLLELRFGFDPETDTYPAQLTVPLSTSLRRGLAIDPQDAPGNRLPFTRCDVGGCYVERPFTEDAIALLAAGDFAVTIADKAGQPIRLEVQADGLADGISGLRAESMSVLTRIWKFGARFFDDNEGETAAVSEEDPQAPPADAATAADAEPAATNGDKAP